MSIMAISNTYAEGPFIPKARKSLVLLPLIPKDDRALDNLG
jgi:hypothetical protein